ncbi:hypothetical protein J008_01979 [Cryptococcus neoformans]|nr:hypothetical protein J008_01979 [Cryptococcus neoformans var. grubii]
MSTSIDDTNANFGWFGTTWSTNHTVDPMADDYYDGTLWVLPTGGRLRNYCLAWDGYYSFRSQTK